MRLTVAWTWRDLNVDGYYVAIVRMFLRMWMNGSLWGHQYSNGFSFCYAIDLGKLKSSKILALLNLVGHSTLTVVLIRESVSL